jgi:hypothetical protein
MVHAIHGRSRAVTTSPLDRQTSGLLYALRLAPVSSPEGLQGEVEHVVTGERFRFLGAAELVAWLEACRDSAAAAVLQPDKGEGRAPPPRRATT